MGIAVDRHVSNQAYFKCSVDKSSMVNSWATEVNKHRKQICTVFILLIFRGYASEEVQDSEMRAYQDLKSLLFCQEDPYLAVPRSLWETTDV
jgi:hypothetical protein